MKGNERCPNSIDYRVLLMWFEGCTPRSKMVPRKDAARLAI